MRDLLGIVGLSILNNGKVKHPFKIMNDFKCKGKLFA